MKSNKDRKKRVTPGDASISSLFSNLKYSLPATVGIFLLLTGLLSLALYFLPDPAPFTLPAAFLASALAAFFGGLILCKRQGNSALLCGLVNGCFYLCILLLVSLFFRARASGYSPLLSASLHLGALLCSVLGGYAGLPKKQKKRR